MSRNDNAHTPDEGTGDTTYAFPAHLLGELDAPAAEGVEPRVSAVDGPPSRSALLLVMRGPNAGSQFPLDQPVTSAGPASGQRHLPRRRHRQPPPRRVSAGERTIPARRPRQPQQHLRQS